MARIKPNWYQFLQRSFACVQALMHYSPSPNIPVNKQQQCKCLLKSKGRGSTPGWAGSSIRLGTNTWRDLSPSFSQLISSLLKCLPDWSPTVSVYDQRIPIVSREKDVLFSWVKLKVPMLQSLEGEGVPSIGGRRGRGGCIFIRQRGHIFKGQIFHLSFPRYNLTSALKCIAALAVNKET